MVLTALFGPFSFLCVIGFTLPDELGVSSLKCIHGGGRLPLHALMGRVLSVLFCNAGSSIAVACH